MSTNPTPGQEEGKAPTTIDSLAQKVDALARKVAFMDDTMKVVLLVLVIMGIVLIGLWLQHIPPPPPATATA